MIRLADKLQSLLTRATAITMGTDSETDASALLNESNPLWSEISARPVEMLPVVTTMATALRTALESAPEAVKNELASYREAAAAAKFDWVEPPRAIIAFMVLDALERIRDHCAHKAMNG